jgi:hypothetical protein
MRPACAQLRQAASAPSEYELKAMFFVTLARYTQWPTNSFPNPDDPLLIGVFGHNPFGNKLDSLVSHEQVQGHALQVVASSDIEKLKGCHMIFFGGVSPALMELSLARVGRRPILTVSDQRGFLEAGGMIELFLNDENRVRLKVSRTAVERADLNLSPTLWRLAEKIALYHFSPFTLFSWVDKRAPESVGRGARSSDVLPPHRALLPVPAWRHVAVSSSSTVFQL